MMPTSISLHHTNPKAYSAAVAILVRHVMLVLSRKSRLFEGSVLSSHTASTYLIYLNPTLLKLWPACQVHDARCTAFRLVVWLITVHSPRLEALLTTGQGPEHLVAHKLHQVVMVNSQVYWLLHAKAHVSCYIQTTQCSRQARQTGL